MSGLGTVPIDALRVVGQRLLEFLVSRDTSEDDDAKIDTSDFPEFTALAEHLTGRQMRRLQCGIKDMSKVREFLEKPGSRHWDFVSEMPKTPGFPEWWGPAEDQALVESIGRYGAFVFCRWLLDPIQPFRKRIPPEHLAAVEKLAMQERKKTPGKGVALPREMEDFAHIGRDKSRMSCALAVIDFIEKKAQLQPKIRCDKVYPAQPLRILELGEILLRPSYKTRFSHIPLGFAAVRLFPKQATPGVPQAYYKCEVKDGDNKPLFVIQCLADPEKVFEDESVIEVWIKLQMSLGMIPSINSQTMKASLSLFGLLEPVVLALGAAALTRQFAKELKPPKPKPKPPLR
jgi:hypothetical protein